MIIGSKRRANVSPVSEDLILALIDLVPVGRVREYSIVGIQAHHKTQIFVG
jgi:hypothetical protein